MRSVAASHREEINLKLDVNNLNYNDSEKVSRTGLNCQDVVESLSSVNCGRLARICWRGAHFVGK